MPDPFNLQRFVDAQESTFEEARRQLRAGHKTSHWMWFIFPQIAGLGQSFMAKRFAIGSREEATAYLVHELLGPRLRECTALVNHVERLSIRQIFGSPDDLKFRSSMTLFAQVTTENQLFTEALEKYFAGDPDTATLALLDS